LPEGCGVAGKVGSAAAGCDGAASGQRCGQQLSFWFERVFDAGSAPSRHLTPS
jgi:hypothetical protein